MPSGSLSVGRASDNTRKIYISGSCATLETIFILSHRFNLQLLTNNLFQTSATMSSNKADAKTEVESEAQHQGVFKPEEGKIDRRHGDPDAGGKTSGQKAADTRAERYGDKIHYDKK